MRRAASAAARLARRASPFSSSDAWAISDVVRLSSGVPRSSLFSRGWSDPPVRGYARWVKAILPDGGERWIRDAPSRSPPSDRPGVSSRPRRRPDPRGTFSASGTSSLRDRAPPLDPSHPDFGELDFNRHLVRTRSPEDVLRAWDAAPPGFDPSFINVSTAVTKLDNRLSRAVRAWRARAHDASGAAPEWAVDLDARVTTAVTDLARDPRFISILRAVIRRAPEFGAQALANVAHGVGDLVGKLGADPRGAVSTETSIGPDEWDRLVRAMSDRFAVDSARLDRELNAQEVANAYNGAAWFPDLAETMGPASWSRLARSVERVHDHLNEQGVSLVLNALANGPHMREASRAMTSEGWRLLAGRATATADRMNEQATSGTVNALAKLSDASDAMDAHGGIDAWRILARRVARTADRLNQQGVTMTLNAVGKVPTLAEALRGTPDAWPALAEAARRTAPHMRAQGVAVVLNALWKIPDVRRHISDECLRTLAARAEATADEMTPQAVHLTGDALNKLPELAAHVSKRGWARLAARTEAAVVDAPVESLGTESSPVFMFHCLARSPELSSALGSRRSWRALARKIRSSAAAMSPEETGAALNAVATLRRVDLVMGEWGVATWRALAKAAVRVAPEQDSTHASLTWDAAKKLEGFRDALDAERGGFDALARRFVEHSASIEPLHVVNYASALGWVRPLAEALADAEGGWAALTAALERHEDVIAAGGAEEIGLDGKPRDPVKWMEKTVAGVALAREHPGFESYGDDDVRARVAALEARLRRRLPAAREQRDAGEGRSM